MTTLAQPIALDPACDLLAVHQSAPNDFPGLLQSVLRGTSQARYDILFAAPGECLRLDDNRLTGPFAADDVDFLQALDAWSAAERQAPSDSALPFTGGWMLYLGYELAGVCEPVLQLAPDPAALPVAYALRCHAAVVRCHATQQLWLVGDQQADLPAIAKAVEAAPRRPLTPGSIQPSDSAVESAAPLTQALERIRDYILAGDVFQVNLSRGWRADFDTPLDPAAVYAALREHNPGPFAGLIRLGDGAVVSSSPERLLRMADGVVETRPIAGTRRRGSDDGADAALQRELIAHPKERAEHVMLIDLERNDLGRICEPGSVEVDDMMAMESYAHVHHIVSNVRGRVRADVGPGQAIRATFPGGTITGCPKVRCMQIIAELEPGGRGAYTGAIGYLGADGRMDLNILIRTIVTRGRQAWLRAGAGIVADSQAEAEIVEMQSKARGMLPAIGLDPEFGL